jgi:hypothetical protein
MEKALSAVHDLKAFWFLEKPVEPRAFKILLGRAIRYKRSLQNDVAELMRPPIRLGQGGHEAARFYLF